MESTNPSPDLFNEPRAQQTNTLKTLTILTFIGCGLSYISLLFNIATWSNYEKQLADAQDAQEKFSDNEMASRMMEGSVEMLQKSHQYRYILLASGLIFTTMCLVGALQMRKLKKSGYPIYVVGEIAPLLVTGILIGFNFFGSIILGLSGLFALIFVILYTRQRKHLIY
jgi:hypothetical protein